MLNFEPCQQQLEAGKKHIRRLFLLLHHRLTLLVRAVQGSLLPRWQLKELKKKKKTDTLLWDYHMQIRRETSQFDEITCYLEQD